MTRHRVLIVIYAAIGLSWAVIAMQMFLGNADRLLMTVAGLACVGQVADWIYILNKMAGDRE